MVTIIRGRREKVLFRPCRDIACAYDNTRREANGVVGAKGEAFTRNQSLSILPKLPDAGVHGL